MAEFTPSPAPKIITINSTNGSGMDIIKALRSNNDIGIIAASSNIATEFDMGTGFVWGVARRVLTSSSDRADVFMFKQNGDYSMGNVDGQTGTVTANHGWYMIKDYSASYTITANGSTTLTGTNLGYSTPSGYTPVAVVSYDTGYSGVVPYQVDARATGSANAVRLKNLAGSDQTKTMYVRVLYIKTVFNAST